ncbi:hypothetical protein FD15_GL001586 [Liquorilactobacillus sucicola DSM 21376 = JCM 15457]|uniref:DUF3114 domain-containing protein n=1 Tax=Liquorilactobacillus sucicola DSM 21376 = JCM 15457 TaxID=1423806 RepID=A0A0R2E011_9LACO|nr:DUF3114 domain-containing protein [Liquorilactobacillus sucicola]KRN05780.1 hypothetical protein FD15_GL001586 [Liquorilactobacillus sucicola DSM 21376 = JCM 15457]
MRLAKYRSKKEITAAKKMKKRLRSQMEDVIYSLNMVGVGSNKHARHYYKVKLSLLKVLFIYVDQLLLLNELFFKIKRETGQIKRISRGTAVFLFLKKATNNLKKISPLEKCYPQVFEVELEKMILQKSDRMIEIKKNVVSLRKGWEDLEEVAKIIIVGTSALEKAKHTETAGELRAETEKMEHCYHTYMVKKMIRKMKLQPPQKESMCERAVHEVRNADMLCWPPESIEVLLSNFLQVRFRQSEAQEKSFQNSDSANSYKRVGTRLFSEMWDSYQQSCMQQKSAQNKLTLLMTVSKMCDLNGSKSQTKHLLRYFAPISPAAAFWKDLAKTVQTAFPEGLNATLNEKLAKNVHQFRYLISAQQIQFVREKYLQQGKTEFEALAWYLSTLPEGQFSLDESARLHQKHRRKNGEAPANYYKTNIKVVVGFHSEYILDGNGNLINEIDVEKEPFENENGIVNGASFNYAASNDYKASKGPKWNAVHSDHYKLDISIPSKMEPIFRLKTVKNYKSPSLKIYNCQKDPNYGSNGQSAHQANQKAMHAFWKEIKRLS